MNYSNRLFKGSGTPTGFRYARLFLLSTSIALAAGCGSDSQSNGAPSFDETRSTNSGAIVSVGGADNRIVDLSRDIAKETSREFVDSSDKPVERLTSADTILADLSDEMDIDALNYLARAARREATIVLKNTDAELMKGFALVTADGIDTLIISNSNGGTTQYVEFTGHPDSDPDMLGKDSGRNTSVSGALNSATTLLKAKQREVSPLSTKTIADIIRRIEKSRPTDNTRAQSELAKIASRRQMSANAALCPAQEENAKFDLYCNTSEAEQSHEVVKNTMSVANVTVSMISETANIIGRNPRQSILDAVLNVEIVAPANERQKYVKVNTDGSFVNVQGMTADRSIARWPFTIEGRVMYYPVNTQGCDEGDCNYDRVLDFGDPYRLPVGWSILDSVPATTDNLNTYVTTTGWSTKTGHTVEVGGAIKPTGPEASASYKYNIEFGRSSDRQERILSKAIRVENNSAYKSDWSWKYTGWDNHWDLVDGGILPIAPAAKTRIDMKSETVYRVPIDEQRIEFMVRARHTLGGILYGPEDLMDGTALGGNGKVNLFEAFDALLQGHVSPALAGVVDTVYTEVVGFIEAVLGGGNSATAPTQQYNGLWITHLYQDVRGITLNLGLVQPLGDRGWQATYNNCPNRTNTLGKGGCVTFSSELLENSIDIDGWPSDLPNQFSQLVRPGEFPPTYTGIDPIKDPYYVKYEGWVKAEYSGKYTFLLTNTNSATLFIGPKGESTKVIARSLSHFDSLTPMEKRGDIYLKAGQYYRVAVYHYVAPQTQANIDKGEVPSIRLSWSHYDDNDEPVFFEQTVPWRLTHSGKYY